MNRNVPLWLLVSVVVACAAALIFVFSMAGDRQLEFSWTGVAQIIIGIVVIGTVFVIIARFDKRLANIFKEYRRKR